MSRYPVKIDVNGAGHGRLLIGDVDVASAAMRVSVDIDARSGGGTQVVLYMRPGAMDGALGEATVKVDAATHEALVALGWSPPGGSQ